MRVRWQLVGEYPEVRCDLSEKHARCLYDGLKKNGSCEWAELVGEELENYMDVLESFDHIERARANVKALARAAEKLKRSLK